MKNRMLPVLCGVILVFALSGCGNKMTEGIAIDNKQTIDFQQFQK